MPISPLFLDRAPADYGFDATQQNGVTVYEDNAAYFAAILADMQAATMASHFVYFTGWWVDLQLPLGSPDAKPLPPTLGSVLSKLAAGTPPGTFPMSRSSPPRNNAGPQIAAMVWASKAQLLSNIDELRKAVGNFLFPVYPLPTSIFGGVAITLINKKATDGIDGLAAVSPCTGILDGATRSFGSHHQKYTVILNQGGLVAYVGSSDYNADRLYAPGDGRAANPPPAAGAPLNDVNMRIVGPAAADVLKSFIDRWNQEGYGKEYPLAGSSYGGASTAAAGSVDLQVTHTYGVGYPFPKAVVQAAKAQRQIISKATQYVHLEDQYLVGSPAAAVELASALGANKGLVVIGVMAPLVVVSDLTWVGQRRSDFWLPLYSKFGPSENNRVLLFEMLNAQKSDSGPGSYLHNKMTIVDDEIATIGSVNFNRRSWSHDTEIMVSLGGAGGTVPVEADPSEPIARKIRLMRWKRHLGQPVASLYRLADGIQRWRTLPSTALVRPWTPSPNTMGTVTLDAYHILYDLAFDPE